MEFTPNSTIWFYNVPFDQTYKNVVWFDTIYEREDYFSEFHTINNFFKFKLTEYVTVRMTNADGSPRTVIRVGKSIEEINANPVNYCMYSNPNLGGKYIHAFITSIVYVNENTTELHITTDIFQTWLFNANFKSSYVVREHSATDEIGDNVVPESFSYEDYNYHNLSAFPELNEWGYLITATEQLGTDTLRGTSHSGIYQGLYFYFYDSWTGVNTALDKLESEGQDCIVSISVIPYFNLINTSKVELLDNGECALMGTGFVEYSNKPAQCEHTIHLTEWNFKHNGYTPKNNKLFTSPYMNIVVTNHNGQEAIYNREDFNDVNNVTFRMCGDVSSSPTVTLYPKEYKGINLNYDCGITISGFPQCAFNNDTYKLWLAKNRYTLPIAQANAGLNAVGGLLSLNAGQAVSGVTDILNTFNQKYQASIEPNKAHAGNTSNNLLTAINMNKFDVYMRTLKKDYAESIDGFFTMYGYQTNKLKFPNAFDQSKRRPCFNYLQTVDINIDGGSIPNDDLIAFKNIFNKGVTIWNYKETMYIYNADKNKPQ